MELVAPLENSLGDSFPRGTSGMIQDEISTDATDIDVAAEHHY